MKRGLKVFGVILAVILILILGFVAFIHFRGIPTYEVEQFPGLKIELTDARVEHGRKLAGMLCVQCHRNPDDGKLSGKKMNDAPKAFGEIYSANITRHPTAGIAKKYTDGELYYLLRTGLKPDGQYVPPWMPKYAKMSDEDLIAIMAYIRSDNSLTAPSDYVPPTTEPSFLSKFLCAVAFKPFPFPTAEIREPDSADVVKYGEYVAVAQLECFSCHSSDFSTNNYEEPEKSAGYFGGGNPVLNMDGEVVPSSNITMDAETGIGKWTEEQFVKAVKNGMKPSGDPVKYPMVPYIELEEWKIKSIYAYLKTIPAINNDVYAVK